MKKITRAIMLTLCFCLLSACGFHPQSRNDFPVAMRTLYFNPKNPNGALATEIKRRLLAAKITLVDSPKKAKVEFDLEKAVYKTNQPSIFYSGNAINFSYSLSAQFKLVRGEKVLSGPRTVFISRSQLHNANQGYTSGSDILMLSELTQLVAAEIMFDLTSHATDRQIQTAVKDFHASQRPAIL